MTITAPLLYLILRIIEIEIIFGNPGRELRDGFFRYDIYSENINIYVKGLTGEALPAAS
jgi:hypothetical protein